MTVARFAQRPVPDAPTLPGVDVGCDVVEVARLGALLGRRAAARDVLFTRAEQADAVRDGVAIDSPTAVRRLAARFAAKEAVVKLLGRTSLRWTDVEVRTDDDGAPQLHILGARSDVAVSLSHDGDVAMAVVARSTPTAAPTTATTATTTPPLVPTARS